VIGVPRPPSRCSENKTWQMVKQGYAIFNFVKKLPDLFWRDCFCGTWVWTEGWAGALSLELCPHSFLL
jgi:hypothetical protein